MKKIILLVFAAFAFQNAFASHVLGGELTWSCQGNGQYVLKLVIYGDCSDIPISNSSYAVNWNGPGTITVNRTSIDTISPQCHSSSASISCDSTLFFTPVVRHQYESAPFTIPAPVPLNGYQFYISLQARPITDNTTNGGANGYLLRAVMYPYFENGVQVDPAKCYDSSPEFEVNPRYAFIPDTNGLYLDGYDIDVQDSIAFSWAPARQGSTYPGNALGYETGYAFNQPLPSSAINPGNSGALLDYTGKLRFKSITVGRFTTCYKIESWRNGYKIAEVFRDFEMQIQTDPGISGICPSSGNTPPNISLSNVPGYDTLTPVFGNGGLQYFHSTVYAGDSVSFNINMNDFDLNSNCTPQLIIAQVGGPTMSASNLGNTDCDGAPCANLISLNSGGSYASTLSNQTRFFWRTDPAHAHGPSGRGTHWFTIKGTDDHCILPGEGQAKVRIDVLRPIYVPNAKPAICLGDTAQVQVMGDTSNLSWSPTTNISCTSCASPKIYPTTNIVYSVTDLNTGYTERVAIDVTSPQANPILTQNGSQLEVTNSALFDTLLWQRSHAPLSVSGNTFTADFSGEYWVNARNSACIQQTDTIGIWNSKNLIGTSVIGGSFDSLRVENATYSMSMSLNQEPYYSLEAIFVQLIEVLPNADYSTLDCKISDQTTGVVFSTDSIRRIDADMVAFYGTGNLTGVEDYILEITTTTYFALPTYRPTVFPVIANNGRVLTFNTLKQELNQPAKSFFAYPFYHVGLKWGIGLEETELANVKLYPNPAKESVTIESAVPVTIELFSILGEKMLETHMKSGKQTISVERFVAGTYFVKMTTMAGNNSVKKLVIGL